MPSCGNLRKLADSDIVRTCYCLYNHLRWKKVDVTLLISVCIDNWPFTASGEGEAAWMEQPAEPNAQRDEELVT
jgi:hypothetical protein